MNLKDKNMEQYLHMLVTDGFYGLPFDVGMDYFMRVREHINLVRKFGEMLGVSPRQLINHDSSKFCKIQYVLYAKKFVLGESLFFDEAWLNHVTKEPHHHNHWSLLGDDRIKIMPYPFVLEMFADWQAASVQYSQTEDMTEWLIENLPKIKLHPMSRASLHTIMVDMAYFHVIEKLEKEIGYKTKHDEEIAKLRDFESKTFCNEDEYLYAW